MRAASWISAVLLVLSYAHAVPAPEPASELSRRVVTAGSKPPPPSNGIPPPPPARQNSVPLQPPPVRQNSLSPPPSPALGAQQRPNTIPALQPPPGKLPVPPPGIQPPGRVAAPPGAPKPPLAAPNGQPGKPPGTPGGLTNPGALPKAPAKAPLTPPGAQGAQRNPGSLPVPTCQLPGRGKLLKRDCFLGRQIMCQVAQCPPPQRSRYWRRTIPGVPETQCWPCTRTVVYIAASVEAAAREAIRRARNGELAVYYRGAGLPQVEYPHNFGNMVGGGDNTPLITPRDGRNNWLYEYPLLRSGALYAGGSPESDRVIAEVDTWWRLVAVWVVTHDGMTNNQFDEVRPRIG